MTCPYGCEPAPCELCEAQAARGLPTPRESVGAVLVVLFVVCMVILLVLS